MSVLLDERGTKSAAISKADHHQHMAAVVCRVPSLISYQL
jgi:hypothetical protein